MQELRQWQQECRTIEDMRANALDSLRLLEGEVTDLQDADKQLKELKDEYNTLKGQVSHHHFIPLDKSDYSQTSPKGSPTGRAKIGCLRHLTTFKFFCTVYWLKGTKICGCLRQMIP